MKPWTLVLVAGALCLAATAPGAARAAAPRQYYSKYWQTNDGYYYRSYYYKPTAQYAGYHAHYVIYYPSRPKYYYYYNPYTRRYWGRYLSSGEGYSKLADDDQRERLADIRDGDFPKPGAMPTLPESDDGVQMDPPPRGLPPDEAEELSASKLTDMLGKEAGKKKLPRQVYTDWCKHGSYYFCCYYYRPGEGDYKAHRCIYYPSQPRYIYYYNPYRSNYWGRYDLEARGYAILAEGNRSDHLSSIPESAFPKPAEMPAIPESSDTEEMLAPPTDLPK
jgi:hypothetical protein